MNYYSKHQEKAAKIAAQGILLMTPQEVLSTAAAMNIDGPNYAAEQRTSTKELAEHFREKCLQLRGKFVE